MAIVMGLDHRRAQITAEWLDAATGEVSRGRIVPADRSGVRRFLARFAGQELEVALEATTGWRFVVEELRRVGASVRLAEPAQTSALRGNKQRAKNDRADGGGGHTFCVSAVVNILVTPCVSMSDSGVAVTG